ncbi:MAG: oligosaccharide flippase family protein [Bradyrhizobiaceae bacterium]|nr:oligosaccharide flippase family protein [Bradyrhizobiaceae bacterium]
MTESNQSNVRQLVYGSVIVFVSQVVSMLIYFVGQRMILSTLTKEENGVLFAERRLVDLLLICLVDLGLNITVLRKTAQNPKDQGKILASASAVRLVLLAAVVIIAVLSGVGFGYSAIDIVVWCIYNVVSSRVGLIRNFMGMPYRNTLRFVVPTATAVLDAVLFLGLLAFMPWDMSTTSIIACFTLGALPGLVIMLVLDKDRYFTLKNVDWPEARSIVKETLPVAGMVILVAIHDKIDAMLLALWSSAEQVGIYGAAYISISPLLSLPFTVLTAVVPLIAKLAAIDRAESERYTHTVLRGLVALAILCSSVASILTPAFIQLVSKGRYADDAMYFATFLWLPLPIFILGFVQEAIVALGYSRGTLTIGVTLVVSTVVSCVLLIPPHAALGATIAKVFSVVVGAVVCLMIMRRITTNRITVRFISSMMVTTTAGLAGFFVLPQLLPMWWAAIVNGLIVGAVAMATGLLKTSDVRLISSAMRSRFEGANA